MKKMVFSVVDVVVLSGSVDGRNYWEALKNRLIKEVSQVVTKCNRLKLKASDGRIPPQGWDVTGWGIICVQNFSEKLPLRGWDISLSVRID